MAGTTTDKLERLMQTKADIKSALIEKGQSPGDVFSEYANMVRAISGGGGGGSGSSDGSPCVFNVPVNIAIEVSCVETEMRCDYEVVSVDGADYGFALNDAGYYESQNKGVDNSFAMCKIMFNTNYQTTVKLNCINYAENNYDFGLISYVDSMLSLDNVADSSNVLKNFKGNSSESVVSVSATIPVGEHYICVKFRKDGGSASGNDSLQFAVVV